MDREKLIAEIRKRPSLWDIQSIQYKTRTCVQDMWKEVADSLGPDVTIDDCKRKWKNLRDAYRAELKRIGLRIERDLLKGEYNSNNGYDSKWAYFKEMKFIKDIKRPRRRRNLDNINVHLSDENDLDEYHEFHNIDEIKLEPSIEMDTDHYSLLYYEDNDDEDSHQPLLEEAEVEKEAHKPVDNSAKSSHSKKLNMTETKTPQEQKEKIPSSSTSCKCPKRSYDQEHFLEDLEKEEQNLMKCTRLDMTRSNDLAHVGDSDYNFLVSFLPQMKKMTELQNLQFRAKMTELMLNIMSQSMSVSTVTVSSSQATSGNSNNFFSC